jgi:2-polyprenyl-3-methyl-5-hydroxy-6-metoxy-1,4-benzoquinol methylase
MMTGSDPDGHAKFPEESVVIKQSPTDISELLKNAYGHCHGLKRFVIKYRPYICPFEEILSRIPPDSELLDVGCGIGLMGVLALITKRARRVVGFDISHRDIEIGRGAVVPEGAELDLHSINLGGWPLGQFDVVTCIDVLHHIPPDLQRKFCARLVGSIRPGGLVLFKDISPKPRWKAWANRLHDLIMARQWIHYRSADEVTRWFGEDGLTLFEACRLDRFWYAHYLISAGKN